MSFLRLTLKSGGNAYLRPEHITCIRRDWKGAGTGVYVGTNRVVPEIIVTDTQESVMEAHRAAKLRVQPKEQDLAAVIALDLAKNHGGQVFVLPSRVHVILDHMDWQSAVIYTDVDAIDRIIAPFHLAGSADDVAQACTADRQFARNIESRARCVGDR